MPDLSAGRPLPLPEKIFTKEDVMLVAKAIGADYWIPSDRSAAARDILTALAAAGRLLPPSAEHREEWGALYQGHVHRVDERGAAEALAATARGAVAVQRTITTGPWAEVDGSPA